MVDIRLCRFFRFIITILQTGNRRKARTTDMPSHRATAITKERHESADSDCLEKYRAEAAFRLEEYATKRR